MKLLIDDVRTFDFKDLVTVRSYKAGIENLKTGTVTKLFLDHDLGGKKTGKDILDWCEKTNTWPKEVIFVSSNPVGVLNMSKILTYNNYKQKSLVYFVKEG